MSNTALMRTGQLLLTNKSGGAVAQGDVVVVDLTTAASFTTTAVSGYVSGTPGVVLEPGGIASNALGMVAIQGYVPVINLSGAASLGDLFKCHSVAKQAVRHAAPAVAGDFGQVLGTGATPAAILWGSVNLSAGAGSDASAIHVNVAAEISGIAEKTVPIAADLLVIEDSAAANAKKRVQIGNLPIRNSVQDFRLTLTTGTPVTTSDVTNATTVYFTPYIGNCIALYDGTSWHLRTSAELSVAVGAYTASRPYDIFIYDNAGAPTIETLVWASATARATALAYQDGVLVKSGVPTRRYVGTVYIDAAQKTQDALLQRYVWNYNNRIRRRLFVTDANAHTYNSTTVRQWRATAGDKVELVIGVQEDAVQIQFSGQGNTNFIAGPSLDVTNALDTEIRIVYSISASSVEMGVSGAKDIGIGYHYIAAVQEAATGTANFGNFFLNAQVMG